MKPIQTLDEAHKYLLYIADALWNVGSSFHIEKQDKVLLEKCANDLAEYAKVVEQVKSNIIAGETKKEKVQQTAVLEERYSYHKRAAERSLLSVTIAVNNLKKIQKSGSEKEIADYKEYTKKLKDLYFTAKQNEEIAKKEMEEEDKK